jgi:F-type H+-transporting ATPase subunit a
MATNPMNQFEVYRIGPEIKLGAIDISFTNASLFMVISSLAILLIFNLGSKKILYYQARCNFFLN